MRKWWPLVTVCLGTFMLLIDVTIVNVALPRMAADLHSTFGNLQWVIDGYALALAVLLLGAGALADRIGHRRLYAAGLAVFALSSLACGLATSDGFLIAARVVQGAGAAAMFTTTFALLNSAYQGRERGVAYGVWGGVSGAAAAIGPVLGGLLTDALNWRWIFLVNLPISIAALLLCRFVLRPDGAGRQGRFDFAGTAAFTVAATALTLTVIRANEHGWSWWLFAVAVVALAGFVAIELRSPHAMFDLRLLRNRSFAGILIAALLVNFAGFAILTYTSIWLQSLVGLTPLQAGLTALPMGLLSLVVSGVAGAKLHGRSPRVLIGTGMLLIAAGAALGAILLDQGSSWPALLPGYALVGLGVGLVMPNLAESGMAAVPPHRGGMAAGALNTARQLGYAIGVAAVGAIFLSRATSSLGGDSAAAHALASGRGGSPAAAAAGLDAGFWLSAGVGLVGALAVFLLVRPVKRTQAQRPEPASVS
ncbi:MFS transporter [Paractinoplanes atraurantiacus]|uniref:Drug resistance transporter, EmrB/QacA subfamily n=1 Tax=Paractinoplanes atraurantiacus TaxID=1036182 RepID=A0A285J6V9_9ACTN|nr:MFS transporter [Actinoplanes atraurantiacus]SNY56070.1 drug resistance transporter, EmrB/QacA subfamily [Actinoplanes atraurantiacus]